MRFLALDIGHKYIGVAISDQLGIIAQGLETIVRDEENSKKIDNLEKSSEVSRIKELVDDYEVEKIVVGLPIRQDGSLGRSAQIAIELAETLVKILDIEIVYQDERYSTKSAEEVLIEGSVRREDRKKYVDKIAAVFILQTYLDSI